jgi:nanoRNase/pAp phosphatase (c-di-AMP/oligoRNAs hydrolase)
MDKKREIPTIAEKNRIVSNIIKALDERDNFLLTGHENPDEDCVSSMVAMGLLLSKLSKRVTMLVCSEIKKNFRYLLSICEYNSINIIEDCSDLPEAITTLIVLDTPKTSMLMEYRKTAGLLEDDSILVIEIDHHLEADSIYTGDPGYRLVSDASSACELVGLIALKLGYREDLMEKYQIENVLSRNFVLATLTGIIGDSKMGKYLKTRREKRFYRLFSTIFDSMLTEKTYQGSSNFSNMEEVYREINRLSEREEQCYRYFLKRRRQWRYIHSIILDEEESEQLAELYDHETVVSIARAAADRLAETSGYVSLVSYYDDSDHSDLVQFRMRRNQFFKSLDLRDIIEELAIENGGGHPGAIGFRIESSRISDLGAAVRRIIDTAETMIEESHAETR